MKLPEEFDKLHGFQPKMMKRNHRANVIRMKSQGPLPRKMDWRLLGAVTKVKDQVCGISPSKIHFQLKNNERSSD